MKQPVTLSDALARPPETSIRVGRVISIDAGIAYVRPVGSNTGFEIQVGGDVNAGDLVSIQNVRGFRSIVGQANTAVGRQSSGNLTIVNTTINNGSGGGGGGGDYLPLTGGTVTGQVVVTDNLRAQMELLLGPGSGEFLFVDPDNFDLDIVTASTERITILNAGNVGIHNTTPAEALDVTGNVKASGTVYADSGIFSSDGGGYTVNPKAQVGGAGIYLFNADGDIIAEINNLGGVSGKYLASSAADGDVPIYLDSATRVPKLNADMVDGKHANELGGVPYSGATQAVDLGQYAIRSGQGAFGSSTDIQTILNTSGIEVLDNAHETVLASIDTTGAGRMKTLQLTESALAPMTVASAVKVTNLNADMVDGVHAGALATHVTVFTVDGSLFNVGAAPFRFYNIYGVTRAISRVLISVGVAPTGQAIVVDIHKNGATIFTNQAHRPSIAANANSGSTTSIDAASWADGDYLEVQVDQFGSVNPGSFMTVQISHS